MLVVCYTPVLHPALLTDISSVLRDIGFDGFDSHSSGQGDHGLEYPLSVKRLFRSTREVSRLYWSFLVFSRGRTILSAMALAYNIFTKQVVIADHNHFHWCRTSIQINKYNYGSKSSCDLGANTKCM